MAWVEAIRAFVGRHKWWQNAIFVVGIVSIVTVFSVAFLGADSAPRRIHTNEPLGAVDSPHFAESLSNLVNAPLERGGTVEVLDNGDGFLPALLRDVADARETINILVYIWEDGRMSDQVLDALLARQRQGVAVRLMVDGLGGGDAPDDKLRALEEAGGRVARYRDSLRTWMRVHRRNHRRAIVIEHKVGYVGGMAISDKWLGNARGRRPRARHDVPRHGPMARRLRRPSSARGEPCRRNRRAAPQARAKG